MLLPAVIVQLLPTCHLHVVQMLKALEAAEEREKKVLQFHTRTGNFHCANKWGFSPGVIFLFGGLHVACKWACMTMTFVKVKSILIL